MRWSYAAYKVHLLKSRVAWINGTAHSVYRTPQITARLDSCCSNCQPNRETLHGEPWGGYWSVRPAPANPERSHRKGKRSSLLITTAFVPPATGTEDESYLSILIPGAGRPCLFILIGSICGTAVAGGGWCWQRFVHALLWQQYSWQARNQAVHTRLINTNNRAANPE